MRLALELILPILLIVCALAVTFSKRLLVGIRNNSPFCIHIVRRI